MDIMTPSLSIFQSYERLYSRAGELRAGTAVTETAAMFMAMLERVEAPVDAINALTERVQMLEEELLARAPMTIALHGRVDALEAKADDGQRLIKAEFNRQGFNS